MLWDAEFYWANAIIKTLTRINCFLLCIIRSHFCYAMISSQNEGKNVLCFFVFKLRWFKQRFFSHSWVTKPHRVWRNIQKSRVMCSLEKFVYNALISLKNLNWNELSADVMFDKSRDRIIRIIQDTTDQIFCFHSSFEMKLFFQEMFPSCSVKTC